MVKLDKDSKPAILFLLWSRSDNLHILSQLVAIIHLVFKCIFSVFFLLGVGLFCFWILASSYISEFKNKIIVTFFIIQAWWKNIPIQIFKKFSLKLEYCQRLHLRGMNLSHLNSFPLSVKRDFTRSVKSSPWESIKLTVDSSIPIEVKYKKYEILLLPFVCANQMQWEKRQQKMPNLEGHMVDVWWFS